MDGNLGTCTYESHVCTQYGQRLLQRHAANPIKAWQQSRVMTDHHRAAFSEPLLQRVADCPGRVLIESGCRLVEDDDARVGQHQSGQRYASEFAAGRLHPAVGRVNPEK